MEYDEKLLAFEGRVLTLANDAEKDFRYPRYRKSQLCLFKMAVPHAACRFHLKRLVVSLSSRTFTFSSLVHVRTPVTASEQPSIIVHYWSCIVEDLVSIRTLATRRRRRRTYHAPFVLWGSVPRVLQQTRRLTDRDDDKNWNQSSFLSHRLCFRLVALSI